jgi:hypothetical protein
VMMFAEADLLMMLAENVMEMVLDVRAVME